MHLRNGTYFNAGPWKFSGASALTKHPASQSNPGAVLNFWAGSATVQGGSSVANRYGLPSGYRHPTAWVMAIKPGGLSAKLNRIAGSGSLSGPLTRGIALRATFVGAGGLGGPLALVAKMSATFSGSGGLAGRLSGRINLAATFTGAGGLAGHLTGEARMAANFSGSGDLVGHLTGEARMAATMTVTGTGLSTANVGEAVLSALVEAGFDLRRVLRIIAATTAGKNGATALKFRDLSDTEDMVDGTFSGGKRTGATYGG